MEKSRDFQDSRVPVMLGILRSIEIRGFCRILASVASVLNMRVFQGINAIFWFPFILGIPRCGKVLGFPRFPFSDPAGTSKNYRNHRIFRNSSIRSIGAEHEGIPRD